MAAGRTGRAVATAAAAATLVLALAAALPASASHRAPRVGFTFRMVRTPGVTCLPNARASVSIVKGTLNEKMTITVHGLPHHAGFDLFVIQVPNKPFGVSWYQTDVHTDSHGNGTATVQGVFSKETFSVSPGGTVTFAPTHQFHLGLWFNSTTLPFNLGCEGSATAPIVTPFNGAQHAGIQILNTSNFADAAGPLSHLK